MMQPLVKRPLRTPRWRSSVKTALTNYDLYLICVPALIVLFLFRYYPMYGIQIAFKDFTIRNGFENSPWVGFKHFQTLFAMPEFHRVFWNTLILNLYRLVFQFPLPIILAIAINEVRSRAFKRTIQTVSYLPHFLSWVVIGAIFQSLLSSTGVVNAMVRAFGGEPVVWLGESQYFRSMLVVSDAWKNTGWGSIVYLAAIMAVDPQLYEAALVDGAGRLRRIWHITLPCIRSTIFFIVILRLSAMLGSNVEQILVLYSSAVYDVGDVLSTYVYRIGLERMKFSFATAVDLFSSVIGFALLLGANYASRAFGERALW